MKRFLCLFLACILCCCGLCGCSKGDDAFVYAVSGTPDTLDPQLADSDVERILAVNLFEGLFRLDAQGVVVPAACESWSVSGDGLTWTFTLREGLFYQTDPEEENAQPVPVTAQDYVFGLQRLFAAGGSSPYRQSFLDLAGAEAIAAGEAAPETLGAYALNGRTLMLRLVAPDENLPRRLCCAGAMPCNKEFYEATDGTYGLEPDAVLCNGLFRLTLWSAENGVTMRRTVPQEGMVNRVRLLPYAALHGDEAPSAADRLAQQLTGGEFISGVPPDAPAPGFSVQTLQMVINCRDALLANRNIRAGLAGVLYRSLPEELPEGWSTAQGLVPGSVSFGTKSWRDTAGSLLNAALPDDGAQAYRQGLAELGKTKLSGVAVLVPDTEEWRSLYAAVTLGWQQQLSAFFSVQYLPEAEILSRVRAGDYDIAFLGSRTVQDDVPAALAAYAQASTGNLTGYADAGFEALLGEARTAATVQQKQQLLRKAELLLLSSWSVVPIVTAAEYFAVSPGFSGVAASPFGPVLDFTAAATGQSS